MGHTEEVSVHRTLHELAVEFLGEKWIERVERGIFFNGLDELGFKAATKGYFFRNELILWKDTFRHENLAETSDLPCPQESNHVALGFAYNLAIVE